MREVTIGSALVSRLCLGGNPFSGFSHQNAERDSEMLAYFTPERIKETLRAAEEVGVNTFFGRVDEHILGILGDYWKEGGAIQWFAQVSDEMAEKPGSWKISLKASLDLGAAGVYIHGGHVDNWYANGLFDNFYEALNIMREGKVAAGFAGHKPAAHEWVRDNLDVDFQMCSHYNPTDRSETAHHISVDEKWHDEDRERMLGVIATIERPVVHYKVFAGGNRSVIDAFEVMGRAMRENDAAVVGIFPKDDPGMMARDVALFEEYVERAGA